MSTKATGVLKDPDNETLSTIHSKYDVVAADKALHKIVLVCKTH
jgi:hypothetical protein